MKRWGVVLLLLLLSVPAFAIDTEPALPNAAMQSRYEYLTHEFRCLVCQDEDIADSNAALAADLRAEVYRQVLQGRSNEQIKQYMVSRYGDFVLFKPPFQPNTWLLWFGPGILLLLGLGVAFVLVRRRNQNNSTLVDDENEVDEPRW
ncbi:MAG: cytochrome c-type biogenesis protein CcmH [Gammaproteobacteria bacterium]|nr:cytochrome c-type biogenesis protein CcmH [Gammaproteobacteria bacterium]MDE2345541.1 cytochrome c-type biogenesis protein CcmH [Gammaproteobacteria bacterium]